MTQAQRPPAAGTTADDDKSQERTGFQERAPYDPSIDLRTDFVMAYGLDESTPGRIARWREAGYQVHLMTGVSWGEYNDYLNGEWDGRDHWDDAQADQFDKLIMHGTKYGDGITIADLTDDDRATAIPYMVPTISFTEYLIEKLRPIIALDVEAVHLEEPECWVRGGYSESFKREWQAFYRAPWEPPHGSVDAHFRSGRLMQHLLTRSIERVATVLGDEALQQGKQLRFSIPTHSLLNYTQWQIVSPESRLRHIPGIDGAIAQVWTGTSRTPNVYAGRHAERTFETAYLEYGIAQDLTRGTDRTMWFLHDPIEDHPGRTWEDYFGNYQRTLVASLLHPGVTQFEVAPWPNRIFNRPYLSQATKEAGERIAIPAAYSTTYLVIMQVLRDMDQPDVTVDRHGPRIGVVLSDTAMFQRWSPGSGPTEKHDGLQNALSDEGRALLSFSDFYGLALPPLFEGQQVVPVLLEAVLDNSAVLDDFDVIIASYEFQKPTTPAIHFALAGWVNRGGALLYVGDGADPYHQLRSWWTGRYPTAAHHLAEALGTDLDHGDPVAVGAGWAQFVIKDPTAFTESPAAAAELVAALQDLAKRAGHDWHSSGWLSVQRGPYLVGASLSEAEEATTVTGRFVDLLDARLGVVTERVVAPDEVTLLRDLDHAPTDFEVIAAAARIRDHQVRGSTLSYVAEAPTKITVVTALRVAAEPAAVAVDDQPVTTWRHDAEHGVLWVEHPGDPAGTSVHISLA